jgi:hypothetical protein
MGQAGGIGPGAPLPPVQRSELFRTFSDKDDAVSGYFEADLVAHSCQNARGA